MSEVAIQAARARDLLAALVQKATIRVDARCYWGQWLDNARQHDQKGVYGTTAAVELLVENGVAADQELVKSALDGLPVSGSGDRYKADDADLVFKVAAIVQACGKARGPLEQTHPAVLRLIAMRADERGWGGYSSLSTSDTAPALVPTAVALLALAHTPEWGVDQRCRPTLVWLSERLAAGSTDEVGDALGLLALQAYRSVGMEIPEWQQGTRAARVRIIATLKTQTGTPQVRSYHYPVDLGEPKNEYMYFSPAIVGALALLSGQPGRRIPGGPQVVRLVRTVAAMVVRDGAFRHDGRVATVDQLWVDRLLHAFGIAARSPTLLLQPVASGLFGDKRRWFTVPAMLALAVAAGFLASGNKVGIIQVLGGVASGLILNVIANQFGARGPD